MPVTFSTRSWRSPLSSGNCVGWSFVMRAMLAGPAQLDRGSSAIPRTSSREPNLVEHLPRVLSETFTLSLLTAVLLKGVLEVVLAAKNRVKRGSAEPPRRSAGRGPGRRRQAVDQVRLPGE